MLTIKQLVQLARITVLQEKHVDHKTIGGTRNMLLGSPCFRRNMLTIKQLVQLARITLLQEKHIDLKTVWYNLIGSPCFRRNMLTIKQFGTTC